MFLMEIIGQISAQFRAIVAMHDHRLDIDWLCIIGVKLDLYEIKGWNYGFVLMV